MTRAQSDDSPDSTFVKLRQHHQQVLGIHLLPRQARRAVRVTTDSGKLGASRLIRAPSLRACRQYPQKRFRFA